MKILAVETSGLTGSVALWNKGQIIADKMLTSGGQRHAQTLVLETGLLLKQHALAPGEIDAVAISIGPGSFTGLRVGVVFAKVFAWVNGTQLIAVDTLQAVAEQTVDRLAAVTVISDAQRGEVFVNDYHWDEASQSRVACGELRIEPVDAVVSRMGIADLISGPGLLKFADRFPASARMAEESLWQPRATSIARIGSKLLQQNITADIDTLEPLYVRRSYAEEKRPDQPVPGPT